MRLVRELLRPYRGWLLISSAAMLTQTVMSLAAPWPLKIVIHRHRRRQDDPGVRIVRHAGPGRGPIGEGLIPSISSQPVCPAP